MSCDVLIHAVIFSKPPPLLLHLCALGIASKKKKNLFSKHLIGHPPLFFICERLDLRFFRACFQFLGGPDEDE